MAVHGLCELILAMLVASFEPQSTGARVMPVLFVDSRLARGSVSTLCCSLGYSGGGLSTLKGRRDGHGARPGIVTEGNTPHEMV